MIAATKSWDGHQREVVINVEGVTLEGALVVPADAQGIVLFAHGSGSSRHSSRNQFVARKIQAAGIGTLLFDLLSEDEEAEDAVTGHLRFDIDLLARRLETAVRWIAGQPEANRLGIEHIALRRAAA